MARSASPGRPPARLARKESRTASSAPGPHALLPFLHEGLGGRGDRVGANSSRPPFVGDGAASGHHRFLGGGVVRAIGPATDPVGRGEVDCPRGGRSHERRLVYTHGPAGVDRHHPLPTLDHFGRWRRVLDPGCVGESVESSGVGNGCFDRCCNGVAVGTSHPPNVPMPGPAVVASSATSWPGPFRTPRPRGRRVPLGNAELTRPRSSGITSPRRSFEEGTRRTPASPLRHGHDLRFLDAEQRSHAPRDTLDCGGLTGPPSPGWLPPRRLID